MRRTQLISTLFTVFLVSCFTRAQSLEWLRESKFDTIRYPGVRHVFVQLCTDEADSVIANGSATFLHANIDYLGECLYRQTYKDTILTKVELSTKGPGGYDRLARYFGLITAGAYNTFIFRKETTLVGYVTRNGVPLCVTLFTDKRHKRNEMVIEPVAAVVGEKR